MREGSLTWAWLGRVAYKVAMGHMDRVASEVNAHLEVGRILFLEHSATVTLGRRASVNSLRVSPVELDEAGIDLERADRGGQATYHGPGQLVVYPVVNLKALGMGVKTYIGALERAVCCALAEWGINDARQDMERPGVWTAKGKIAAVGLRVHGEIATHGFALNLKMDKQPFNMIVACGMPEAKAACVADFIRPPEMSRACSDLARHLGLALGRDVREEDPKTLLATVDMTRMESETKMPVERQR